MGIHLIIYLAFAAVVALLLGYELRFTEATKLIGVELFRTHDYNFDSGIGVLLPLYDARSCPDNL